MLARAEERADAVLEDLRREPRAVVGDADAARDRPRSPRRCGSRRPSRRARRPALRTRLSSAWRRRSGGRRQMSDGSTLRLDAHRVRQLRARQRQQLVDERREPHIARRLRGVAGRVEQLSSADASDARDLVEHQVDALAGSASSELGAQVGERHLDARQRVAQLVRDRGRELAGGGEALGAGEARAAARALSASRRAPLPPASGARAVRRLELLEPRARRVELRGAAAA